MSAIVIALGDPAGIGPEVTFKAIQQLPHHPGIILCLHPKTLDAHHQQAPAMQPWSGTATQNTIYYVTPKNLPDIQHNTPDNADNATIAYQCLLTALHICDTHNIKHLVTAPISKQGFLNAGIPFTGHTTLLQNHFNCPTAAMGFYAKPFSVVLCTIHIPLSKVEAALTPECICNTLDNAQLFAKQSNINKPRIAVAGLNPHASENGQFGTFEADILAPTLATYQKEHPNLPLFGPISPDVVFRQAHNGNYDMVVAMYHDQGLIPLKLLAFDTAVNVTIGLPICRTSPDHGTAYDIAGSNSANPNAMHAAIQYCIHNKKWDVPKWDCHKTPQARPSEKKYRSVGC